MNTATFTALADPYRLQMVELLRRQPLAVGEIASRLGLRQPQTSKHLRILSDAGIIDMQASANRRICSLRPEPFRELDAWISEYRLLWEERFDQLDTYLQTLQTDPTATRPPPLPNDPTKPGGES
ncbi:ArsR/SmtB family transcription factor [Deinococcus koreensis]|uniref:Transcriptional regulator n=1 Tax=Deinococcus koreensis TaxID=2054903 RepID=A0A2K3V1K4_9DEIO|nr:metalloregulator ArsR/SmtB family transcription factor [Deinococcus koreensis]PNY82658.1 transcriptional regulator [Deinococcus koreensis]